MKRYFSPYTIIIALSALLISCYHKPSGFVAKHVEIRSLEHAHSFQDIDAYIKNARYYYELGFYEMAYNEVYDALLSLDGEKGAKAGIYEQLMAFATEISRKMHRVNNITYRAMPEISRPLEILPEEDHFMNNLLSGGFTMPEYFVKLIHERGARYVPYFKRVLQDHGIPAEFVIIPLIESGFDAKAVSHRGAAGMWQIMEPTAISLGLYINYWVDKRFDPYSSAKAAASYLRYLFERFQKWELALAAYNCGETRLAGIIRKIGSDDISMIIDSPYLPNETREYIRRFYYLRDRIDLSHFETEHNIKQINIPFSIRVEDLLKHISIGKDEFYSLNQDLKKGIIPYSTYGHNINVFTDTVYDLDNIDESRFIQWNIASIKQDISIDYLAAYLKICRNLLLEISRPNSQGMVQKGTTFLYPRLLVNE